MAFSARSYVRPVVAGVLVLGLVVLGAGLFTHSVSEAGPPMPAAEQAYWTWVASINRGRAPGVEPGVELLLQYPAIAPLYLRLATLCRDAGQVEDCDTVLAGMTPPTARTALYRQAARLQLQGTDDPVAWQDLARAPALDPALARLVVDVVGPGEEAMQGIVEGWRAQVASDSAAAALFGLGYTAALRSHWEEAEAQLLAAARRAPSDPHPYRELGRIYFFTGRAQAFEKVLAQGIAAAEGRYDLEQQLILRGNLAWGLVQQHGDLQRAEELFREALAQSRLLSDGETEGFNLYRLASVLAGQERYKEALPLLDSADVRYLRYRPRYRPDVQVLQGTIQHALFRFREAETLLLAAVKEAEDGQNVSAQSQALVALAQLRYSMDRPMPAREAGFEALRLARRYALAGLEITARLVLGDVEHRVGNFVQAEGHYRQGLQQARETGNRVREEAFLERLGRAALSRHQPDEAGLYFDSLLVRVRHHPDTTATVQVLAGLGTVYKQYGNYTHAQGYYEEALALLQARGDAGRQVDVLLEIAWNAMAAGRLDEAEEAVREARRQAALAGHVEAYALRLDAAQGTVYLQLAQPARAIPYLNAAARQAALEQVPSLQWPVAHALAQAYALQGAEATAETWYREAVDVVEAMRESLPDGPGRAVFVQDKEAVYADFAGFLVGQGRAVEAFHVLERARSRSLADLMFTARQQRMLEEVSPEERLIEAERRRRAVTAALASATTITAGTLESTRTDRVSRLRAAYAEAEAMYRTNLGLLSDQTRRKALLAPEPATAEQAQALLEPGEALVFYHLRPQASQVFMITQDTLLVRPLPVEPADVAASVHFFRDQINHGRQEGDSAWVQTSRLLYAGLIAPVHSILPASITHLHLVPEGDLYYLPFAALQDAEGRFLVERYSLSVTPSASVLGMTRTQNPRIWRSILLLADPDARLPGARREVEAIASIPALRPLVLVGEQATQQNFKTFAEGYDILHLATHGTFEHEAPWLSSLAMQDGVLRVDEISELRLNAYLVVLSACETALSGGHMNDVPAGGEWVGFNQAFLAAGTPTVLTSLWAIDDQASSSFMVGFYEALLAAHGKARALADIQRSFIRAPATRHPFYWAAFTLVGDPL